MRFPGYPTGANELSLGLERGDCAGNESKGSAHPEGLRVLAPANTYS